MSRRSKYYNGKRVTRKQHSLDSGGAIERNVEHTLPDGSVERRKIQLTKPNAGGAS